MSNKMYEGYNASLADWERYIIEIDKETAFPWTTYQSTKIEKSCNHEWKETRLVISSVYDCKLCGEKKENVK